MVWITILIASFRGGGDQYDNPRYRVTFIGLQAILVAWALFEQRRAEDPWLRRALVGLLLVLIWFIPWYIRRRYDFYWPVQDVFKTVGAGLACAVLYFIYDWAREHEP
jgi:hypothetical protein